MCEERVDSSIQVDIDSEGLGEGEGVGGFCRSTLLHLCQRMLSG